MSCRAAISPDRADSAFSASMAPVEMSRQDIASVAGRKGRASSLQKSAQCSRGLLLLRVCVHADALSHVMHKPWLRGIIYTVCLVRRLSTPLMMSRMQFSKLY